MSDNTNTPWIRRKSTLIGGGLGLLVVLIAATIANNPSPAPTAPQQGKPGQADVGLGTAGQTAEFNQTFAQRLREDQAREAEAQKKELKREMEAKVAAETERIRAEVARGNEGITQKLEALTRAQEEAAAAAAERAKEDSIKSLKFIQPRARPTEPGAQSGNAAEDAGNQGQVKQIRDVIPPQGFVKGRLLNGVVATVGDAPTAFLVALEGSYKAANGYTVNLNGCMATVEGRPNLAAGRIDGKPAEVTCNFEKEGRTQTWPVSGWIVDATDGIRGLSSIIVDNTGKKITASALAAALAAAGTALNESQYSTNNSTTGTNKTFTGSPSTVLTGGAVAGAGQGLTNAINEHYALYKPTLQKGANAEVTLVITNELTVPPQGSHITRNTNVSTAEAKKQ